MSATLLSAGSQWVPEHPAAALLAVAGCVALYSVVRIGLASVRQHRAQWRRPPVAVVRASRLVPSKPSAPAPAPDLLRPHTKGRLASTNIARMEQHYTEGEHLLDALWKVRNWEMSAEAEEYRNRMRQWYERTLREAIVASAAFAAALQEAPFLDRDGREIPRPQIGGFPLAGDQIEIDLALRGFLRALSHWIERD